MNLNDCEYIWIKCTECNDFVKVAKNKGSYFSIFDFLKDFFILHSGCGVNNIILEFSNGVNKQGEKIMDNWKHRSEKMRCGTCMWFVRKDWTEPMQVGDPWPGRCRCHAPTMNGYPVVYDTDWCGDHKIDENKIY